MSEQFEVIPGNEVRLATRDSLNLLELAYAERFESSCRDILTTYDVSSAGELIAKQKRGEVPRSAVRRFADEVHALSRFAEKGEIDWNKVDWKSVTLVSHLSTQFPVEREGEFLEIKDACVTQDGNIYVLTDDFKLRKCLFSDSFEWSDSIDIEQYYSISVTPLTDGRIAVGGIESSFMIINPETKEKQFFESSAKQVIQYDERTVLAVSNLNPSTIVVDTWDIISRKKLGSWIPVNGEFIYPAPNGNCILIGATRVVEVDFEMVLGNQGTVPIEQWSPLDLNVRGHAVLPDGKLVLGAFLRKDLSIYDPQSKKVVNVIEPIPQVDVNWIHKITALPNGLFCTIFELNDGSLRTMIINPYTKEVVKEVSNGWGGKGMYAHPSGGFVILEQIRNEEKKYSTLIVDIYGNKPQYK